MNMKSHVSLDDQFEQFFFETNQFKHLLFKKLLLPKSQL